ncbi:hypothetical protein Rhal01_03172 [Rubritalea halochordaticola]|uniref:Uncharacterized protein n=2 Tax=Rubritalea halochordaticola TaxID=714537 RepID=A0ABP9V602_9BACT
MDWINLESNAPCWFARTGCAPHSLTLRLRIYLITNMKLKYIIPGIASAAMLLSSCGKKEEATSTTTSQETAASTESPESTEDTPAEAPKKDLTPSATVEGWVKDMRAGRIVSLWNSMPAKYQSDVQGITRDFGAKVDSEIYNETMKTLSATSGLLKSKKGFILELAQDNSEAMGEDKVAAVKENYDAVVNLVDAIVNSDIKDTDSLKSIELTKFFGDIQPEFQKVADVVFTLAAEDEDISWMDNPKAELVSESGDTAEVKDPENNEETMKLKRVDNRWVPEEMTTDWDKNMEEARQGIAAMEGMEDMQKQQMLGGLRMVQAAIKQLDATKTKEEFQQKLMEVGQQFGPLLGGGL